MSESFQNPTRTLTVTNLACRSMLEVSVISPAVTSRDLVRISLPSWVLVNGNMSIAKQTDKTDRTYRRGAAMH